MTKDFRNVGRIPTDNELPQTATPPAVPEANQRIVLGAIRGAAIFFLAAGVWLLSGGQSPLPAETAFYVGIAFVVSAVADFAVIVILKRAWAKPR